jgi:hypothetical protein
MDSYEKRAAFYRGPFSVLDLKTGHQKRLDIDASRCYFKDSPIFTYKLLVSKVYREIPADIQLSQGELSKRR